MRRAIGGAILTLSVLAISPCVFAQAVEPLPVMPPMLPISPTSAPSPDSAAARYYRPIGGNTAPPALLPYDYTNPTLDGTSAPALNQPVFVARENTYLSKRPGVFKKSADGKNWTFTADARMENAVNLPTLTILPSRELAALEDATRNATEARYAISGTITIYNEKPFLLIDIATPADGSATLAAEKAAPAPGSATPATKPATPLPADQMLNQMLKPSAAAGSARPIQPTTGPSRDSTSGSGAVAPGASVLTVLREGSFVVDRTGRLTRGADGQSWEFTFDADGRSMKDPPVFILPNLKLMAMEQASKSSNRDLRFRITGMLTEYAGRNYVLLEKVVVVPDAMQQF